MKYVIINSDGEIMDRDLDLYEAADAIMTSDSREWKIVYADGYYSVYCRHPVANRSLWSETNISSCCDTFDKAKLDICKQIVYAGRFTGHYEAIEETTYDEIMKTVDMY